MFEQLFFFQLLALLLLRVCFPFKLYVCLVATALYPSNPARPNKGDVLDWNLDMRDLKPDALIHSLFQDNGCITHKKLTFFLGILDGNSGILALE